MKIPLMVKRWAAGGLVFLALLSGASALFIVQMDKMIQDTTSNTVQEIATHDRLSIENFLERNWNALDGVYQRLVIYDCRSILAAQEQLGLERTTGEFHTLYLVAENGTVYNDRYASFTKEQMDMQTYLDDGQKRVACRYDYTLTTREKKEMLLYAVALDNFELEGVRFTHLVGISPINQIQAHMDIYSFYKDGEFRGYTSVINPNGDYIVNTERTVSVNKRNNLYDLLDRGTVDARWKNEAIRASMQEEKTFQVTYTDERGVSKFLFFVPLSGVNWYMMATVEQSVFTDMSRTFIFSSVSMVLIAVALSVFMLIFLMRARRNEINANAVANAKTAFLSNMSHEIRTPLNGITGLLHLMRTHLSDGNMEQMASWIQKASDTAQYLLSLVSDILDMSKLDAGKLSLNMEPFLLGTMLDAVETMQRGNAAGRNVELILEKDISVPCIVGDELRLKQVLMNIVGNAVKFTPAGGTIQLRASQAMELDGRVATTIVCTDSGIGMTQEFQKHIWDSFSQEHNKASDGTRGTGLGMAISKGIIDAMGGEVSVVSEPGRGSTFTVVIHSVVGDPGCLECLPEDEAAPDAAKARMKLLIAEDNELNAEILMEILADEGYEAVLAENGRKAVDAFQNSAPWEFDAILMDMQMPVMDGCQAAMTIRALNRPDARSIVIFACTANSFQEDRRRALASGMDDFLTKPINIEELLTKLAAQQKRKVEPK